MKKINLIMNSIAVVTALMISAQGVQADQLLYAKKKDGTTRGHLKNIKNKPNAQGQFDLGKGWELSSSGGLSYINPQDDRYWFKLSGVVRLDETLFTGTTQSKATVDNSNIFPSGANIRAAEAYLDGGVGPNWVYNLSLSFSGSSVSFSDAYVSYMGLVPNNQIFVGRLSGNWFGLDGSNSTSWNPFLERSMGAIAFYPQDGIGVMTDFWGDSWALTLLATQSDATPPAGIRDRWKGLVRATVAPVHEEGNVWHFGVSGMYRQLDANGVYFGTVPSARARSVSATNYTQNVLNTTYGNVLGGTATPIQANYVQQFNVEMARQYGPWMLEGEYTNAYVHRTPVTNQNPFLGSVNFHAWNVQTRYLLTGESHQYDVRDGNFSTVKPINSYGAVELAARYDYINLNDKDVYGGAAHNATVGINWFLNQQLRLSANYIRSRMQGAQYVSGKRNLNIVGLRCQLRFK